MNTANVRTLLRLLGVVTMFAGIVGASVAAIGLAGVRNMLRSVSTGSSIDGSFPEIGMHPVWCWLAVAYWGLFLCTLSSVIARAITSEPEEREPLPEVRAP